jgi:hypothetical protein
MMERVSDPIRKTFGKELREHGTVLSDIARSRAEIDQARLLVLSAARKVDTHGAKAAMKEIGIAKVCPLFSLISFNFFPYHSRILFFLSFPPNLRCSLRSSSSLLSDPSPSLFSSSQSSEATVKAWTNTQFSVPEMALKVVDRAIQVHGAEGISQDQPLAYFWASLRTLKFADVSPSLSSRISTFPIGRAPWQELINRVLTRYTSNNKVNKNSRGFRCFERGMAGLGRRVRGWQMIQKGLNCDCLSVRLVKKNKLENWKWKYDCCFYVCFAVLSYSLCSSSRG